MRARTVLAALTTLCTTLALAVGAQAAPTPGAAPPDPSPPQVRVKGELLTTAVERHGTRRWFAVRTAGRVVPVAGPGLDDIAPGSTVTLDVAVPQQVVADEDIPDGGPPSSLGSTVGRASVDAALAPGAPDLAVTRIGATTPPVAAEYVPATRQITYVAVTPRGLTREPVTTTTARAQVSSTDAYWRDNSGATLRVGVPTVRAQYTSAYSCSTGTPFDFWIEAMDRLGWVWQDDASLVINLPRTAAADGCGYGFGTLGVGPNDGGMTTVSDTAWPVLAHEIGHNMSLGHANWLGCPGRSDSRLVDGWWPTECTEYEYEDGLDIMGYSDRVSGPMLSAPQAVSTGMLPAASTVTAGNGTTTVTLRPLSGLTETRAAVATNAATGARYYVEYRTATGRDSANATSQVPGVRVLRPAPFGGSVLLDATPGAYPDGNAALAVGRTLSSHDGRITVTTVSASSTQAVVRITNNATLTPFVNRTAPAVTGSRGVGKTLTATKGTWSPTPSGYAYEGKRNGIRILGATGSTYRPTTADAGRYISVLVTPRRTGYTSAGKTSARVGIPIHATTRPYLAGAARVGGTMTVMVGTWTPKPGSYAYQWYRNGAAISGATGKTYRVTASDRGKKVQAKVIARRTGYSTGTMLTYSKVIPR